MENKNIFKYGWLLFLAMLTGGWLSVLFGKELSWDLAYYHFYIPFAFLHHRYNIDFWPSSYIHQFFNPTIDLLSYFLITHFTPRMTEFILGALHGINTWLLFLIARHFIQGRYQNVLALLLSLLGMYGPTALPGMGSFQNDNLISVFILAFTLLQIKALDLYQKKERNNPTVPADFQHVIILLLIAGWIIGLGFGLKLTAGTYIAGTFIASLILPISLRDRIKILLVVGIAATIGMLITSGHWMYLMWQKHRNPFFPFFNNLFHSPDFLFINWHDKRFFPQDLSQTLFFPFYFSWDGRTADAPFRDFRFLAVYILFVIAGIQWLWKRVQIIRSGNPSSLATTNFLSRYWLFAFFIFSYMIWQYYFSIARYLSVLEMLSPLIIYLLLKSLIHNSRIHVIFLFIILYTLAWSLSPIPMVRARWYDTTFFNVKLPPPVVTIPKATVLLAYTAYVMESDPRPQSYLIPFFPAQWRFVGVPFWKGQYLSELTTTSQIYSQLHHESGNIYLLTSDLNMPALYQAAQKFGLVPYGECEKILSDRQVVTHQNVLLCPVTTAHSAPNQG
ncbi:MAG: hypothetical protein KIT56_00065 [Gammaproteobacteria bacterium]|nr:hypothetical protein [Gammaproteobacteria bacterium]MCW5582279.1 hypothetical protein [Gammaproteobacteria bacterium]